MEIYTQEPVNKEDGFYATIDYTSYTEDKDVKLEDKPSITFKDILEVKKTYQNYGENRSQIDITLTKEGARKFYHLTRDNIGKPIAIVIEKRIVTLPIVNSEIMGGKVSISGAFSEQEIDNMIEKFK